MDLGGLLVPSWVQRCRGGQVGSGRTNDVWCVCVCVCVPEHYRDEASLWDGEEQLGKVLEINSS